MNTVTEFDNVEMLVSDTTGGFVAELEDEVITIERKYLDLYDFANQCLILFKQCAEQKSIVVSSDNWQSIDIRSDAKTLDTIFVKVLDIALNYVSGKGGVTMEFHDQKENGIGIVVKGICEDCHLDDMLKFHTLLLTEPNSIDNNDWNVCDTTMLTSQGVIEMRYHSEQEVSIYIKYSQYN